MKPAVLKSVEWHEPAYKGDGSATLADAERPSMFDDEDDRESGVRALPTQEMIAEATEGNGAPDHVGPYRLIERIGSGAMGHVYRAEHTLLGRVVAIKMLRAELTCDEACVRRFLAEARAVNLIKHQHIIDVTDFACTPSGQPWFVMEMLEGSDLSLAASHESLTLPRTLEIVRQVCEALAAVHGAGVVHRDVKPENIFVAQRDGKDFVTLLDFGIARLPDPTAADPLQEGLMGTPHYMAPEQIQASPIDHRADLYAVGSTLFELIAGVGRTPFRAATLQKQLMDVLIEPAPRLSDRATVPAIVRQELDSLVARCLAKQPSDRPSSASEIADELVAIAAKLEDRVSGAHAAQSDVPTLMLRGADAVALLPEVEETRTRARRAPRMRGSWTSSRGATVLSAAAAAAAMWIATSETSWAHAVSRVSAWRAAASGSASTPEHVVAPVAYEDSSSTVRVADPAVDGVGGNVVLVAAVPKTSRIDVAPARDEESDALVQTDEAKQPTVSTEAKNDEARLARKAARAKARLERASQVEQPALVITPSSHESEAQADDKPAYDRDLVLNPFSN